MKQLFVVLSVVLCGHVYAHTCCRPDVHAPIEVMGGHGHAKGENMLSLRYSFMDMRDLIGGSSKASAEEYGDASGKMMVPDDMSMKMLMLGYMRGLGNGYTLMLMQGYMINDMSMSAAPGHGHHHDDMDMKTEGLGDTRASLIKDLSWADDVALYALLGASFPTGKINKSKGGHHVGYPMQLGSGSYGLAYGLTGFKFFDRYSLGAQFYGRSFLNDNDNDYKLGDEFKLSAWVAFQLAESTSASLRIERQMHGKISGKDKDMDRTMSTLSNEDFSERTFDFARVGLNHVLHGALHGHRVSVEYGVLVNHDVEDFQLAPNEKWTLGWQMAY